jgi:hypothetical protein
MMNITFDRVIFDGRLRFVVSTLERIELSCEFIRLLTLNSFEKMNSTMMMKREEKQGFIFS